jgi:thymidine kinase
MFSGKTSEALRIIRQFKKKSVPIKVFKHSSDIRYDDGNEISSHDQDSEECTPILNINDVFNNEDYNTSQVIVIEESQFFGQEIIEASKKMVNIDNKYLILVGLSGDFEMEPIGYLNHLISFADDVKILTAYCHYCDEITDAQFTIKIDGTKNKTEVGTDQYKPTCRKHYIEHTLLE